MCNQSFHCDVFSVSWCIGTITPIPKGGNKENIHESIVSFVSRRYMRVVNGSLVVCLSEYLPLHSVMPETLTCQCL